MIKFEKVSYDEFVADWKKCFGHIKETKLKDIYEGIKLPKRATYGSAGYDFFAPTTLNVNSSTVGDIDYITIPTGIRLVTDQNDLVLLVMPRSGLGFKYGERLANTVGVIDSDYQYAKNEGHIMVKLCGESAFTIREGDAFCQGILLYYTVVDDDLSCEKSERVGGFGSTTAQ